MRLSSGPLMRALALLCGGLLACGAQARMQSLDDEELSAISGQGAMLTVDASTYQNYQYTRLSFGADVSLLTNIDQLSLGNYSRTGANTVSNQPSDILINNFALGRVDNANSADAKVVPFQIQDPYVEFAFQNNNGVRQLVGARIGFGKAQGDLSGDILSLTGNLQGQIYGPASIAYDYYTRNGCPNLINCLVLAVAGDTPVYADVVLLKSGTGEATINGQPINRATQIGIAKGDSLHSDAGGLIASLIPTLSTTNNCQALGLTTCFDLTNYKTIYIGKPGSTDINTGAQGIFFSLQNQNVPWQDLANAGKFVDTQSGAFANFPKVGSGADSVYPILINLYDALRGLPRQSTCMGSQAAGC
ncbi:hypothetical protein HNP46_007014 [Pseudomonas nitritireducens]|uniref:Uncharacterized protein n=1 Tax=Pseudomonas nitroreducens TaxID=46680 RepID=A0A7W7KT95_PSENT|nr:hypothetical protein [Pseudomonas nitritireducens]MBB4868095.1 hypothetical protein [Pseudomonas nitritireducens]